MVLDSRMGAAAARDHLGIADFITELNRIRRAHPALHRLRNLRFHSVDQPELMCFSKRTGSIPASPVTGSPGPAAPGADTILVVVNVNPFQTREATVWLDLPALGVGSQFTVTDELTGESYTWGESTTSAWTRRRGLLTSLPSPPVCRTLVKTHPDRRDQEIRP